MLFVRDVIRMHGKRLFRIVGIDQRDGVLLDLNASGTRLERHALIDLVRGAERGKIALVTDHGLNRARGVDASDARVTRAQELYRIVTGLLCEGSAVFDRAARGHLVAQAAKEHQRSSKTIHAALRRFWKFGMTVDALLPAFDRCGGAGVERGGSAPLGRKGPSNALPAPRISPELKAAFEIGVNRYYRNNAQNSLAEAFRLICKDLGTECVIDPATGAPVTFLKSGSEMVALPTLRQFRYWYGKQRRASADQRARMPEAKFQSRYRARLSYAAQDNENIGGRFVVDATKLDLNLVSRLRANIFLSTPTLYVVIDELTGFIGGFALSLEDSSWTAVGMALLNVVEDKVSFCARYGIEIIEDDWPIAELMGITLLFDRGETKGKLAEQFGLKGSLTIENTAPYRGDLKGIVEQRFNMVNLALKGKVPGYRSKHSGERGEKDPRLDAILDLDDATAVIIHNILYHNRTEMVSFRRSRAMIEDNVPPIPIEMWRWAMDTGRVALSRRSYAELMVALLPTGGATITQRGLQFEGLYYTWETAEREKWFEFVTSPAHLRRKTVSYHPWLVDVIYVHGASPNQVEAAVLTPHCERYAGISFEELKRLNEEERGRSRNRMRDQILNYAEFSNNVRQIVEEANARRLHRLRPRDLVDARGARRAERELDREDHRDRLRSVAASRSSELAQAKTGRVPREIPMVEDLGEGGLLLTDGRAEDG